MYIYSTFIYRRPFQQQTIRISRYGPSSDGRSVAFFSDPTGLDPVACAQANNAKLVADFNALADDGNNLSISCFPRALSDANRRTDAYPEISSYWRRLGAENG